MYDFKSEDKIYLNTQNLKTQQLLKKLDWKFTEQLMIKQKISSYIYELELSSEIKVHSMFHISLLWLLKNDLIGRQVLLSQSMIVENEEGLYFIDLIDDMKWNMQAAWFKLLIKWKGYEQWTWKLYMTIKHDISSLIKEFHHNHSSQPAPAGWVKEENQWLLSDTWTTTWIMKAAKTTMNQIMNETTPWTMTQTMLMSMTTNTWQSQLESRMTNASTWTLQSQRAWQW